MIKEIEKDGHYKNNQIMRDLEIDLQGKIFKFGDYIIKFGHICKKENSGATTQLQGSGSNKYILQVEYSPLQYLDNTKIIGKLSQENVAEQIQQIAEPVINYLF